MSHVIIAVGGTGQVVLHYYNQLYLLGMVKRPYKAIVIDTDEINLSLKVARDFFAMLRVGTEPWDAAGPTTVPTIDFIHVSERSADQVCKKLTALALDELMRDKPNHPAFGYFSKEELAQSVEEGLYTRPALSAVISRDWARRGELTPGENSHVVVVGSILGGTGGGLLAPILATLGERRDRGVKIRAVLFGDFFDPDRPDDKLRFVSNQTLGLRSIQDVQEAVDHFAIVGTTPEERMSKRLHGNEKKGLSLTWPTHDDQPYWRGVEMVHEFLEDTTRPNYPEFAQREVGTDEVPEDHKLPLATALNELQWRLGRAEALVQHQVVERLSIDPWARWVWGRRLVITVADFWGLTAPADRPAEIDKRFCTQLQGFLDDWWRKKDFNLPGLFPQGQRQKPTLSSI